jgi:hypothetical protein
MEDFNRHFQKTAIIICTISFFLLIIINMVKGCSPDPIENTKPIENVEPIESVQPSKSISEIIKDSEDYDKYKDIFDARSSELIAEGTCKEEHFTNNGPWLRSGTYKENKATGAISLHSGQLDLSRYKPAPLYFMYCGEFHFKDRVYLNVKTGKVSQELPTDNQGKIIQG